MPLFNTILINVTAFFRDKAAWNYLQHQAINRILEEKTPNTQVRIWSAGCSSGEEAYTLAMILAEAIGIENFRQRMKIYATDIDEEALTQARHASYSERDLRPVPNDLRQKYFETTGGRYVFRPDLRRAVIFGRHDLVQDAPISRLDLLVCRNTLMYFNAETQAKILNRFHFALNNKGILFLGKAEMMLTHTNIFTPVNLQHRIFRRVPTKNRRDRLLYLTQTANNDIPNGLVRQQRIQELAFDAGSVAQIIIDFNGNLVLANTLARSMFNINLLDIEHTYSDRRLLVVRDVARHLSEGKTQYLDVHFNPLEESNSEILGISISFVDISRYHELQQELQRSNQELETTNEELQSSNEELETTNE